MHHDPAHDLHWKEYKTLLLSAPGGALELYDFIIFVFLAPVLGDLFFPADMPGWLRLVQTFGIFAAGYLTRPLGGIVMAHFGDRVGRKKMFTLSIFMMALPTLTMGMLPVYTSTGIAAPLLLLLTRMLQGVAVGGEVPGAWVFVSEHIPGRRTGLACGVMSAGLGAGILLGSTVALMLNSLLSPQAVAGGGWRIPFLLGGLSGMTALYLRRWLKETPVFLSMQLHRSLSAELPLKRVILNHKKAVVMSVLLTWMMSAGIVVVLLMTPVWLQKQMGISPQVSLEANSIAIAMQMMGGIIAGMAIDRFGAGRTLSLGSLLMAGCCWLFYTETGRHPDMLFALYALAGLSVGVVSAAPYVLVRAFPAAVRFSGVSFSYNIAYAIFGGLTPVLVIYMMKLTPLAPAYCVMILSVIGILVGILLHPGVKGKCGSIISETDEERR
ncbi:TPA: MFS transporter [Enterobacter ludwigii]